MLIRLVTLTTLIAVAPVHAQAARLVVTGNGEVVSRMATRIPGVSPEQKARLRVSGDSAQRIALTDYAWKGRVISVEIDEQDTRLFWDVKIEPDANPKALVRYRVDATNGGILGIREFPGGGPRRP